jgi:acyl carrier protein
LDEFEPELAFYGLHPALLDSATGFLFGRIGKSAYIPFSYKRLRFKKPLGSKIFSHSRLTGKGGAGEESLKFDVTIMDEQGRELVDIEEFTMLQVSEDVQAKIREKENRGVSVSSIRQEEAGAGTDPVVPGATAAPATPGASGSSGASVTSGASADFLKNGILPSEGVEALERILAAGLPQVVISTTDLPLRLEKTAAAPSLFQSEKLVENRPAMTLLARPTLSSAYVAPKTGIEQQIADIWQQFLGFEQIGIHDNFFELGGDSLSIVQLNAKLKKVLERDIPVAVMFKYLTIQSFVRYLEKGEEEEEGAVGAAEEAEDRSDQLQKGKDRLKSRISRR